MSIRKARLDRKQNLDSRSHAIQALIVKTIRQEGKNGMKDIELRLISELMKNSRRSDRDLAKAIGVSQPTVTRVRTRLEKEGYIREYTMIPDLKKLGYAILALTFVKLGKGLTEDEIKKAQKIAQERLKEARFGLVMLERGIGKDSDGIIMSYHKDLESLMELRSQLREFDFLGLSNIESFLISMHDEFHYGSLTFSALAKNLLMMNKEKEKEEQSHE